MANIEDEDEGDDKEQLAEEVELPKRKMIATIKVRHLLDAGPSLAVRRRWHRGEGQRLIDPSSPILEGRVRIGYLGFPLCSLA